MSSMNIKAKDIMTEIIVSIHENAFIKDAAHLMLRDRISGLLVINQKKKIVGILTLTDFLKIIDRLADGKNDDFVGNLLKCRTLKVRDVMTKNICSIGHEMTLRSVIKMMINKNIHTFPVLKGRKLFGVVGRRDIINAVFYFSTRKTS